MNMETRVVSTSNLIAQLKRDRAAAQSEYDEHIARANPILERIRQYDAALAILPEYVGQRDNSASVSVRTATFQALRELGGKGTARELAKIVIRDPNLKYDKDIATLKRSLRGILSRANRDGTIVRVQHGVYALADQIENGKAPSPEDGQELFRSGGD